MSKLNTHLITHSNIKPFKCQYCDSCYTQQGILKRHMAREHAHHEDLERANLVIWNLKNWLIQWFSRSAIFAQKNFLQNGILLCISESTLEQGIMFVRFVTNLFRLLQILTDIESLVTNILINKIVYNKLVIWNYIF